MSGPATIRLQAELQEALNLGSKDIILACPSSPWSLAATIADRKPQRLLIACPEEYAREELVLWLRLRHRLTCRILLAGFLPEEELLATKVNRAERYLIHAPGNKYVQLPLAPNQLPKLRDWLNGPALVVSKIDEEYQPCLRAGFDVNRFRHSLANKFGLKCAWDMQNLIREKDDPYPEKLKVAVETDKNLLIAGALHPLPKDALSRALSERTSERRARIDLLIGSIEALQQRMKGDLSDAPEALEQASELLANTELLRSEVRSPEHSSNDRVLFAELAAAKESVAEPLEQQAIQTNETIELDEMVLPSLEADLVWAAAELEAVKPQLREDLLSGKNVPTIPPGLKVLHVDDELELGWSDLLKRMIDPSNANPQGYRPLQPTAKDVHNIKKEVLAAIAHVGGEPDVILLDLRLLGEDERLARPDSPPIGLQVLNAIRKEHRTIPIIITTASNKMWSYQAAMKAGADGYWMKQGVELDWSKEEVRDNHIELLHFISRVQHQLVLGMRIVERLNKWVNDIENQWWTSGYWYNGLDTRNGDTARAKQFLLSAMTLVKSYCVKCVYSSSAPPTERDYLTLASAVNHLGCVAEWIIAPDLKHYTIGQRTRYRSSNEDFFQVIHTRNEGSHKAAVTLIRPHVFCVQAAALDNWLRSMGRNGSGTP